MNRMRAAAAFGLAVLGSQAGHLLAYEVRFAGAAQQIQSTGAHWYFPVLARTLTGFAATALLACLFMAALARILAGRRLPVEQAPSTLRLVSALFTLQLGLFAGQELIEAHLAGTGAGPGLELVLWGTLGQLPAAVVGAAVLRWVFMRLVPAARQLLTLLAQVAPSAPRAAVVTAVPAHAPAFVATPALAAFSRRGPPFSS